MPRNLDLTALRAFVTVADAGGVTRAAGLLNFTQSAVSMQLKRLEEGLGKQFFNRSARKLALTPEGEQLLTYARKMLALNDEALARMNEQAFEGELRLGVPDDIVYPELPSILKRMAADFPRLNINLETNFTTELLDRFDRGLFDVILTTEASPPAHAEVLDWREMVWVGARDGQAWQNRPLRLGFHSACAFKPVAQAALDQAGIPWEAAFSGKCEQANEAILAADLAVSVRMQGSVPLGLEVIEPGNALPELDRLAIALYNAGIQKGEVVEALLCQVRCAFGNPDCSASRYDNLAGRTPAAQQIQRLAGAL